ncbi:MAG TPA: sensor histidine kinase [Actinomycetes bacterium]|nr:sensor histidine kinase [Actinomycetes bacterium]
MDRIATRLRLPEWAQDIVLALLVAFFQIVGTRRVAPAGGVAQLADPAYLGYLLLAVPGLALLVRRRWPMAVLAITAAISLVYYTAGYPDGPGWIALFIAAYTVNARGDGERSVQVVGGTVLLLSVVWLLTADLSPIQDAGWVFFRIGTAIMAVVLGDMLRARRVVAAEALERAERAERTREEEARRRVDAERLRIAREVHDTVAHAIAVINVQAGVTAHVLDRRPERARETLVTIEQTSARALSELRATLGVLRDAADGQAPAPGLAQVEELVGLAREAGLDLKLEAGSPPRELPGAVDQAAYRIVQESLTNAIRHAGPARVTVSIVYGPDDLELRVADDGRGPCEGAGPAGGGRGIVGMRERAELLGGELVAGPGPDRGFQVRARLPLRPRPEEAPR